MSHKQTHAGFTLIEMLVALAIITGIVTMVYGSYVATTQSMDVRQARMACSERAQLVLRLMARHVRCAYVPATDPNAERASSPAGSTGAVRTAPSRAGSLVATALSRPPTWFWGDTRAPRNRILSLVTTSGPATGADLRRGLCRVMYMYDRANSTLSISTQQCVDLFGGREKTAPAQPVLSGVTAVSIRFYDGRRWRDEWDYDMNKRLPHAVKFEFTAADETKRAYQYGITVPVACQIHAQNEDRTITRTGNRP